MVKSWKYNSRETTASTVNLSDKANSLYAHTIRKIGTCVTIDHYIVSSGLPPMCRWWWLLYLCSIHILENRRIVYFRRSIVVAFVPSDLVHQTLIHSIVFLILMNHFVVNNVLGISGMTCFSVCIILDLI